VHRCEAWGRGKGAKEARSSLNNAHHHLLITWMYWELLRCACARAGPTFSCFVFDYWTVTQNILCGLILVIVSRYFPKMEVHDLLSILFFEPKETQVKTVNIGARKNTRAISRMRKTTRSRKTTFTRSRLDPRPTLACSLRPTRITH
jgi:hypothetical protein